MVIGRGGLGGKDKLLRQGRSEFFIRAEPERREGGWSEEIKNREGVAAGGATTKIIIEIKKHLDMQVLMLL